MALKWTDTLDIAIELDETHPDADPFDNILCLTQNAQKKLVPLQDWLIGLILDTISFTMHVIYTSHGEICFMMRRTEPKQISTGFWTMHQTI